MATGTTTTAQLADSIPTMIQAARLFEEYDMIVPKTVDRVDLRQGEGTTYNEIRIEQFTAQGITEQTVNENFQMFEDTLFSVEPGLVQIAYRITDKTYRRLAKNASALLGKGAQLAMNRKLDQDGITQFANFSTTLAGTGTTLTSGHIAAAVARIKSNTTETGMGAGPIHAPLHGFGIKDLEDEIKAGIGTYNVPSGMTEQFYRQGLRGDVAGANVWWAGNITANSTPDARGAVYAQKAMLLVREMELKTEKQRFPGVGGGADAVYLTAGYAYGERRDVWGFGILHDATVPTS